MKKARRRFLNGLLSVVAMTGLMAMSLTPASSAAATTALPPAVAALQWQACASAPGFQCASMPSPLDYNAPNGAQINIAMIRHVATDSAHRAGSLFWNPGGPGAAATANLPAVYRLFPAALQARYDIVGLDPRGIGGSAQLRCFATPEQENALLAKLPAAGFPVGAAEQKQEVDLYAQFDRACAAHGGPIQYHMSTANDARDLDRARQALGEARLNYYGISYGTYLGVTYANMFPARVGHIVLDGNVPPVEWNNTRFGTHLGTFLRLGSPIGTETALQVMLAYCGQAGPSRCAFSTDKPGTTLNKYRTLLHRLRARPVTVDGQQYSYAVTVATVAALLPAQNNNGVAPGWAALTGLLQSLWTASASPTAEARMPAGLARALHASAAKPGLAVDFDPQLTEGRYGLLCGESPNPTDPNSYPGQARIGDIASPDGFGDSWAWLSEPCAQWQARDADRYTGPWNRYTQPYLLIGTLADPETAYPATLRMAAELPNARVLTETGGGHTALLNKSSCIDGYVSSYFLNGTLPPPWTLCDQNLAPF